MHVMQPVVTDVCGITSLCHADQLDKLCKMAEQIKVLSAVHILRPMEHCVTRGPDPPHTVGPTDRGRGNNFLNFGTPRTSRMA